MRYFKILLFLSFIFVLLATTRIFAQVEDSTDCTAMSNDDPDQFVAKLHKALAENKLPELAIFTDKDIRTAVRFQQQYCCERRIGDEKCEGKLDGKHYYPESPFFFDHLVNIGMRKFDGIKDHCDTLSIDCITRDGKAPTQEWREQIRKLADDTNGVPPIELLASFTRYRGNIKDFSDTNSHDSLANAYVQMCNEASTIRKTMQFSRSYTDTTKTQGGDLASACRKLVQQRYIQEAKMVQALMIERGVQYVYDNLNSYMSTYFVDNRMQALVEKFGKLDACFNMVLKYVTKTSCCVN